MINNGMLLSIGIAQLQHVFVKAQEWTKEQKKVEHLITEIPQQFFEYTAIAFEGVAMELAVQALKEQQPLRDWKIVADDKNNPYPLSSYLGLGMALAKLHIDPSPYVSNASALLGERIWAGYGYYNSFFGNSADTEYLKGHSNTAKSLYWQGVGRSCFYKSKGDLDELQLLLQPFDEAASSLWRGVGIASTYLGAGNMKLWTALKKCADIHHWQLAVGAIIISTSIRLTVHNICHDLLQVWTNCTLEQAQNMHRQLAQQATQERKEDAFLTWITLIEETVKAKKNLDKVE